MELEKKILSYVLCALARQDLAPLHTRLAIALEICNGMNPWEAEKVLNILFGGDADAE